MKLTRVELENWGVYRGLHKVPLDVPDHAPVVLIYGENATGKTTFANAIRWAFYGSESDRGGVDPAPYLEMYRSQDVATFEISVVLYIEKSEQAYEIRRKATATRDGRTMYGFRLSSETVELMIGDDAVGSAVVETSIRRLLPSDLSDFFLFDGEELSKIDEALTGRQQTSVIKSRISDLLGLPVMEHLLEKVEEEDEFIMKRIRADEKSEETNLSLQSQLAQVNAEYNTLLEEDGRLRRLLDEEQTRLKEIREKMTKTSELTETANRLNDAIDKIEEIEENLVELGAVLIENHEKHWYMPVADLIVSRARIQEESLAASSEKSSPSSLLRFRLRSLTELTESGVCPTCGQQCGSQIEALRGELALIEAELRNVADVERSFDFDPQLSRWSEEIRAGEISCLRDGTDFVRLSLDLSLLRDEKKRLESQMHGYDRVEVLTLLDDYDTCNSFISEIRRDIDLNQEKIDGALSSKKEVSNKIVNAPGVSPIHRAKHNVLLQLKSVVTDSITLFRERIRAQVEEAASEYFLEVETDPHVVGLSISSDFEMRILSGDRDNPSVRTHGSAAQKLTTAYALIGALIQVSGNSCFWLVDTPIARADQKRSPALWKWIGGQERQVIVLPHSKEITPAEAQKLFANRLGRELEIVRTAGDLSSTIRSFGRGG